jgi:hypothetical protein
MNGSKNCNCDDCEAMKILLRLQFNLRKRGNGELVQALDAAIADTLFVPG